MHPVDIHVLILGVVRDDIYMLLWHCPLSNKKVYVLHTDGTFSLMYSLNRICKTGVIKGSSNSQHVPYKASIQTKYLYIYIA